jgi:NAD-dependent dihydropyrimidine dehydrogenase PreA subunit/flavodoxin
MLFYFSGTGNSLYIAKELQGAIGSDLVDIASAVQNGQYEHRPAEDEGVGFIFPVYFFGVPTIVRDFIDNLSLHQNGNNHTFLVLTCGATTGNADGMFSKLMGRRDYRVDSVSSVIMPNNYVLFYEMESADEQARMLANADIEIAVIISRIRERQNGDFNRHSGALPGISTAMSYPMYTHGRRTAKFHVTDACIGCGQCERMCPSRTIKMVSGRPEWAHERCVRCLACINRCPQKAIQYGKATEGRGRYSNPNVKFEKD